MRAPLVPDGPDRAIQQLPDGRVVVYDLKSNTAEETRPDGKVVRYEIGSWEADRRMKQGKPPHWRNAIVDQSTTRYYRSRALRFGLFSALMGRRR